MPKAAVVCVRFAANSVTSLPVFHSAQRTDLIREGLGVGAFSSSSRVVQILACLRTPLRQQPFELTPHRGNHATHLAPGDPDAQAADDYVALACTGRGSHSVHLAPMASRAL